MKKNKERINLATEIVGEIKRQLIRCRIVLAISLTVNMIQAAMWLIR